VVLRDGHRVAGLLPAQIDADTLALAMLGASAAPRRAPASDRSANHTADQPSDRQPAAPAAARPVVLELRGLSRRGEFGPLDLQLRRGEIVGLTGRLGAGRSELAQTLFGLRRPDAGALLLHGRPLRLRSNRQAIAAGIAYLPEDRLGQGLVLQAAVADNLVLASAGALAGLAGRIDRRRSAQLVDHALRELDIKAPDPAAAVATLSGGNQQRVVLGKWLATQPALLILDAPTVGVDITARAAIHASVRQIAAHGVAVLLISDEVGEVWAHSERVLVMREGRLLGSFDPPGVSLQALTAAVHG
jgi:simple sugar transport system ATP-binding protein